MTEPSQPERIAVVGLGFLGRGIAARFLGCGFEVVAVDRSVAQHATAREQITQMIDELVELGGFDPALRAEWSRRYTPATGFELLSGCSFVVESVTEDPAAKVAAIEAIEAVLSPRAVIASNTSSIPITQLQTGRQHPERFVGMHWAEPAHATRFMELIRGDHTSEAAFQAAAVMARRLGKEPSLVQRDVPAFIVNRVGYAMYREALHLLDSGVADAETIDTALRNSLGLWSSVCGPLRWIDLTGGPELYAKAMQRVLPSLSKADDVPPVMQQLAASGARGVANGRGFFDYTPEQAQHWEELYRQHAWRVTALQNEYFPLAEVKP